MIQSITSVKIARDRKIPDKTQVVLRNTRTPGHVGVKLRLPWQKDFVDFGNLPIINHEVVLPVKLVFLCHAKEDRRRVQTIGSKLLRDGFLTWFDEKDLLPGDDWKREIDNAIETCDYFLAFLSKKSCEKVGYVQRELRHALEQMNLRPFGQRFIIPALLDECTPPNELKNIHFLRLWERHAYKNLKQVLNESR
ncbi:MAG: toll/interleukin-1 receptor domain-containing protein [Anaerolineales bacterium]